MGASNSGSKGVVVAAIVLLTAFGGTSLVLSVRRDAEASSVRSSGPMVERIRSEAPTPTPRASKPVEERTPKKKKALAAPRPTAPPPTPSPTSVRTPTPPPPSPALVKPASGGPANYTALLIGLDKPEGSEKLTGSVEDVRTMRTLLLSAGFKSKNVTVLTDKQATHAAIIGALDNLAARTSGKGLAVFLVASHSGMSGGDMTFASGGGSRVARHDVASRLAKIRGKVWSTFATCYAASYDSPGITGKDRIATFSSAKDELSYQIPGAGSVLVVNMVQRAMVERGVGSVEDAFAWARAHVGSTTGGSISVKDGIAGDTVVSAR